MLLKMEIIIYLNYIKELHAKLESGNGLLQVLIGPSQVGKTTSVLKLIEDQYKDRAYYVSADKIFNSNSTCI
jgi:predicted AAA+ superfamily ATPase